MNGYNFTERAKKVLGMAREESARLRHEYVGTEHILLGILREGEGVAATILQNLSVELDDLQGRVESIVQPGRPGSTTGPDLPYTSRSKKVIDEAMAEAREVNHTYVGSEHLLLGLLREETGIAAMVLTEAGVTVETAREEMLRILGTAMPSPKFHTSAWGAETARSAAMSAVVPQYADRVRSVLAKAHDVAKRQQSAELSPIHAAIALLEHQEGLANAALDTLDFSRADALSALEALAPVGTTTVGPEEFLTLTSEMTSVLEAVDARNHSRGPAPGTQHLLLSILSQSPETAGVFAKQRITDEALREALSRVSG